MSTYVQSQPEAQREQKRLLALLAEEAAAGTVEDDRVVVTGRRKGVSLRLGAVPLRAALSLESAGAVVKHQERGRAVYRLAEAGAARRRREQADTPGDAFQVQHQARAFRADGSGGVVAVNEAESPLLWLYRRQGRAGRALIGDAEFAAGERLRADLTLARTMPRLTADWERVPSGGGGPGLTASEAMLAAAQRVERALSAVGPEFSGILMDVCGFLKGLDALERERGWPARSAKVVLCLALAALARHYGLANSAVGEKGRRRRHMWGAADYRPDFTVTAQPASA